MKINIAKEYITLNALALLGWFCFALNAFAQQLGQAGYWNKWPMHFSIWVYNFTILTALAALVLLLLALVESHLRRRMQFAKVDTSKFSTVLAKFHIFVFLSGVSLAFFIMCAVAFMHIMASLIVVG